VCQLALSNLRLRCPQLQHACSAVLSFHCASPVHVSFCTGEVHDLQLDLGPAGQVDLSLQFEPLSEELLDGLAGRVGLGLGSGRDSLSPRTTCHLACMQMPCIF
jgi:hypothetical protein